MIKIHTPLDFKLSLLPFYWNSVMQCFNKCVILAKLLMCISEIRGTKTRHGKIHKGVLMINQKTCWYLLLETQALIWRWSWRLIGCCCRQLCRGGICLHVNHVYPQLCSSMMTASVLYVFLFYCLMLSSAVSLTQDVHHVCSCSSCEFFSKPVGNPTEPNLFSGLSSECESLLVMF